MLELISDVSYLIMRASYISYT